MDNVIFNSLETILNEKKVQIDDLKQKLFGNLYTLQEEIDKVIENIEYFNDINLEELKNVNIIDEDIYLTLCLYKKLYNSKISSMKLNDNQLIQIRNQFLASKKLLMEKIDYLLNNNTDYINMVYQYEKLNNIYHQLERKEPLNEEEFVLLCNIFKDDLFKNNFRII